MRNEIYTTKIQLKRDTSDNWLANDNRVLNDAEPAVELRDDFSVALKIGDGVNDWQHLPYICDTRNSITSTRNVIVDGEGVSLSWVLSDFQYFSTINIGVTPIWVRLNFQYTDDGEIVIFDETTYHTSAYQVAKINFQNYGCIISVPEYIYNSANFEILNISIFGNIYGIVKSDNGLKPATPNADYVAPDALNAYVKLSDSGNSIITRDSSSILLGTTIGTTSTFQVVSDDASISTSGNINLNADKVYINGNEVAYKSELANETTLRTTNDSNLFQQISTETQNRINAIDEITEIFESDYEDIAEDIEQLQSDLSSEVTNRSSSVNSIQSALTQEITDRASEDTRVYGELYALLQQEVTDRNSAISASAGSITPLITAETTARESAISQIQSQLSDEITNRTNSDTTINSTITSNYNTLNGLISTNASNITSLSNKLKVNGILKGDGAGNISTAVFDSEPTQGSSNLISSGTLYNILSEIETALTNIYNLMGGPVE